MKTEYKKITDLDDNNLFDNYVLTDLMVMKNKGRRVKSNENMAIYILLWEKLKEYGIWLSGYIEAGNITFRGIGLLDGFPLENELILKQLYGFTNLTTHIQLHGFDDFATAFDYNVDTGRCELQRHRYGSVTHRIKYDSLKDMLLDINEKGYDKLFK